MRLALSVGRRFVLAFVAALLVAVPVMADDAADRAKLDRLFIELRAAPDADAANAISQDIWSIWTNPSDPDIAARMLQILTARTAGNIPAMMILLDRLVVDYPTYAEGWNQRATMRYLINDFEGSLADIEKVLEFEPRHFGALSGRVLIYMAQGKRPEALREMAAALKIHPFLNERHLFPELEEEMIRI